MKKTQIKKRNYYLLFKSKVFIFFILLNSIFSFSQINYLQHVNPFIGTGGHGHTFPGAVLPFGMVQLSPDTRVDGSWDGCSGYHYSDTLIYGFSHTHLSGTGCSDWGDILIMPTISKPTLNNKQYSSTFSHNTEKASAGFYEVVLNKHKIKTELTVTPRVGLHRYSFPNLGEVNLVLDLLHRDKTLFCNIKVINDSTIGGFRTSEAWAKEQYVYFVMKFSARFTNIELARDNKFYPNHSQPNDRIEGAFFTFKLKESKQLQVKVAISPLSVEGAMKNMQAEASHWDFEKYKQEASSIWNKQLQKIEIDTKNQSPDKLTTFYTSLYHCFIHPSLSMDVDSNYRGRDNQPHLAQGFTNYSVFSLWDTYRALHPLFTVIERNRTSDFIQSFLKQHEQSGRLPMWELSANETDCMIGFHSVSVIADAFLKDINNFDVNKMYESVKAASNYFAFGTPIFNKKGYLEISDEGESVSKSLEYAYDNWCIAQIAQKLNKQQDVSLYLKRAQSYKNLFDVSTGNMRPRKNGNWLSPFSPNEINNHFTEGNSWQYSFYVPHDISGLIQLHGSLSNFENKLDQLFTTKDKTSGRDQADVTGLIGQYAHGNEPSHHMAYLYDYVGKPNKTISMVQQICNNFYQNSPNGLIGNEDCGQMSAWYVFSALGFYPFCPGSPQFVTGAPIFNKIKINLENGKSFIITSNQNQNKSQIELIKLNNQKTLSTELNYFAVTNGGNLDFIFSDSKDVKSNFGKSTSTFPSSNQFGPSIIPAPIINSVSQVFKNQLEISISKINTSANKLVYTIDGSEPNYNSKVYNKSFSIDTNCFVKAKLFSDSDSSITTTAKFFKLKYNYDITISSKANSQYSSEGDQSLIDGIYGDVDWRKGNWLGYQGQDFECVIDFKDNKLVSSFILGFLQDSRSWILFPERVNFYSSNDNKEFTLIDGVDNQNQPTDNEVKIAKFKKQFPKPVTTRYIKIIAKNYGKLPDWHQGKGGEAFIFVDEVDIR